MFFQPCASSLYWNQEGKLCDRKRPPKFDLAKFMLKYKNNEQMRMNMNKELIATTTVQTEQQK
jgi:hypothetical protein